MGQEAVARARQQALALGGACPWGELFEATCYGVGWRAGLGQDTVEQGQNQDTVVLSSYIESSGSSE